MSETENRETPSAPQGEAIPSSPIQSDAAANTAPANKPAPRIAESSFEAAHADLPPLSTIGGDTQLVSSESGTAAPSGARRGRGRGAPAGKAGANGQTAKVAFGVVENPADLTESLSGKHVQGYADQQPRPERKPRETAPEAVEGAAVAPEAPSAESGPKEFVPPVSEGTFKAELNPESERKAREERRQQQGERAPRGEGDRPRGERREGGEFRGDRRQAEGRGEQRRDDRGPRGDNRQPREDRGERRNDRGDNRNGGRNRPQRLHIEAPVIPVQEPTSTFGRIKRWIAEKIWGVPATDEVQFSNIARITTPHSRDWQFGRGQQQRGDNRQGGHGQRRDFRHGNGGQGSRNPNNDGRHRPHARGGNHRDQHGRDGNPRG